MMLKNNEECPHYPQPGDAGSCTHTEIFALILSLALLAGCQAVSIVPTPTLYVASEENPFAAVPPALRTSTLDVLFATDRRREETSKLAKSYGTGRSLSLAFGSAELEIGNDLSWEDVVAESRTEKRKRSLALEVKTLLELGRWPETPIPRVYEGDKLVDDPAVLAERSRVSEQFCAEVTRRLSLTQKKDVYIIINGFNYDFERAMSVTASLWHFLGRQGVAIAYSWPSGSGGMRGYFYDRESGEFTVHHLKNFLTTLATCADVKRVHLIAHSLGTVVVTAALRELVLKLGQDGALRLKIHNLVLAAADLDLEVTSQRLAAERVGAVVKRSTMYFSPKDTILGFSNWLHKGNERLGEMEPGDLPPPLVTILELHPDVQIIDVEREVGSLLHGYFYDNPAVLSDLILLLRDDRDPGAEYGRPLERRGANYWEIPAGYPEPDS